jgi:hypothetical protein
MEKLNEIRWENTVRYSSIAGFVVIATALGSSLGFVGALFVALANTIWWPLKIYLQSDNILPNKWLLREHIEGWLPVATGWAGLGVYVLVTSM